MAYPTISKPYGLKPINLIGGQAFNGGVIREFVLSDENTYAFYTGAVIQLDSVGNPQPIQATPVAPEFAATSANGTAGIVGVCLGVSYVDPSLKYPVTSSCCREPSGPNTRFFGSTSMRWRSGVPSGSRRKPSPIHPCNTV